MVWFFVYVYILYVCGSYFVVFFDMVNKNKILMGNIIFLFILIICIENLMNK